MKTKFKRYGKRTVSILLSLMMIVSCMILGQIAPLEASAADLNLYLAGSSDITLVNSQTAATWTIGNTDFKFIYVNDNRYYIDIIISDGSEFKVTDSTYYFNPGFNDSKLEQVTSGTGNGNAKLKTGNSGSYRLCLDPYGGDNHNTKWVWFETIPDTSATQNWYVTGTLGGNSVNTAMTSNNDSTYTYATGLSYTSLANSHFQFKRVQEQGTETTYGSGAEGDDWYLKTDTNSSNGPDHWLTLVKDNNKTFYFDGSSDQLVNLVIDESDISSPKFKFTLVDPNYTNIKINRKLGANGTASADATNVQSTTTGYTGATIESLPSSTTLNISAADSITDNGTIYYFSHWDITAGSGSIGDSSLAQTTFTPTASNSTVTALYVEKVNATVAWDNTGTDVTSVALSPNTNVKAGDTLTLTFTKNGNTSIRTFTFGGQTFTVPWVAGSNTDGTYTFTAPDTLTSSNATLTYTTGELNTYYIDASLDNTYSSAGAAGAIYISADDGTEYKVGSSEYNTAFPNGFYVAEGSKVTVKMTDTNVGITNHNDCEYIINGFSFSEPYKINSTDTTTTKASQIADRDEAITGSYSFSFYPQSSMEVVGSFKEDKGVDISSNITKPETGTFGRYFMLSANEQLSNPTVHHIYKTVTGRRYVFFDDDLFKTLVGSRYSFALTTNENATQLSDDYNNLVNEDSDGGGKPKYSSDKKATVVLSSQGVTTTETNVTGSNGKRFYNAYMETEEKDYNGYYLGNFVVSNDYVTSLKIELQTCDGQVPSNDYELGVKPIKYIITPTISDEARTSGSGVNVIAKDGTIRGDYKKYADLADTEIYAINGKTKSNGKIDGISINSKAYDGLSEKAEIPQGREVTIKTTIADGYREQYYVRAFNINGETYAVNSTVNSNGEYTCTFTIPSDAAAGSKYEITPIYYYNESYSTNSTKNKKFITFYVENFDDTVKQQWGSNTSGNYTSAILACYAWYGTGNDKNDASSSSKPALGGYPGQPMVYVNGRYEMQVPQYANNGTDVIQGITLNNYVWDYVHSNVLGASTDEQRETINCQTYDYDDFVVLATSMNTTPDFIVFRFKYETENDFYNGTASSASKVRGNKPNGTFNRSSFTNGFEYPFTDYYGNDIDIFNNILTSSEISAGDSETGRFHIVSNGYEENYFGHFATRWYVYAPNGTYIGALPSSALLYYNEEYMEGSSVSRDTVPEDWFMTNAQNTSGNITAALESQKLAFWQVYYDLYKGSTTKGTPSAKGVPVEITYETAIRAEDYNNGGHPRDPALRNDGRWYYSRANATFDANIIVEYKASASDTTYLTDSYVTSANRTAKSNATTLTVDDLLDTTDYISYVVGSKPRFTTDNANHAAATAIVSNENENLGFRVATQYETTGFTATNNSGNVTIDANKTQSYKFEGWFIKDGDSYTAVNETDIAKLTGEVAKLGAVTLVARYIPSTDTVLTITHELYKYADFYADSPYPHNGDGITAVSIAVTDSTGAGTKELASGDISVSLKKSAIDAYKSDETKYLQITLTTTPTDGKIVDVYRKYKPDDNTADIKGYVSFSESTQTDGPDAITGWVSASQSNAETIKNSTTMQTIVYRIPVKNLYATGAQETLKTDVIRFYSDLTYSSGVGDDVLSLNDIDVVFKYYDRDTSEAAHSQTEMISTKPTEVTVSLEEQKNVEAAVVEALTIPVENGSVTGSVSSIGTIMNEYYFWPTQDKAKTGFSGLKNHHDSEALYSASANQGDDSVNLGFHANPYGYIKGETFTYNGTQSTYNKQLNKDGTEESIEKWVTYISVDGTREVSETNATSDPGLVGKVIVWGFNQPREYTITFDAPKDGTVLKHDNGEVSLTTHGAYVSINNDQNAEYSAENKLGDFKGNYNERVGRFYANAQAVNDLSPYLRAVYGITTASTTAKAGVNSDTSDRTALDQFTTVVEGKTTKYVFDGWYDENDAKVSSDRTFANRITGTQHLTAYYRVDGTDDNSGISVTAGTTEHFISSNGTDYVRYTTEVNAFGYPDNDRNIKDIAIVYVVLPIGNNLTDSDIQNIINTAVSESSFRTALAGDHSDGRTVTKITVTVEGTTANVTSISYDVVDPGEDATNINTAESTAEVNGGLVKLTNKNRVAFTINFKSDSVASDAAYGDIVVFAAITHENGTDTNSIDTSENSDEIVVSSNFVRYKNGDVATTN